MIIAPLRSSASSPYLSRPLAASPRAYTLVDLGQHEDGSPLLPVAINAQHEICASSPSLVVRGLVRGFRVSPTARTETSTAYGQSPVMGLSDAAHIAGATGAPAGGLRAWASHLGSFGDRFWPDSVSAARGVNASGQVAGNVLFDLGEFSLSRAFVLRTPERPKFITPPQGGTTVATGINDAGDVVFNSAPLGAPAGETHAWCLHDNRYVAIGSLGGGRTWATAITPQGRIVGHSITGRGETHAFLWEDGHTLDLGTFPGTMSQALSANDTPIVVGRLVEAETGPRAFRWAPDLGLTLLEDLVNLPPGWKLHEAVSINRDGVIVGLGTWGGEPRGFILRPEA